MLAVLGFVTILLVLALIMSKKVSTLVALIFVPAITGFIAAFINAPNVIIQAAQAAAEKAGTAYGQRRQPAKHTQTGGAEH